VQRFSSALNGGFHYFNDFAINALCRLTLQLSCARNVRSIL
jgi:hypothetical protein